MLSSTPPPPVRRRHARGSKPLNTYNGHSHPTPLEGAAAARTHARTHAHTNAHTIAPAMHLFSFSTAGVTAVTAIASRQRLRCICAVCRKAGLAPTIARVVTCLLSLASKQSATSEIQNNTAARQVLPLARARANQSNAACAQRALLDCMRHDTNPSLQPPVSPVACE